MTDGQSRDVLGSGGANRRHGRADAADRKRDRGRARLAQMRMPADRRRFKLRGATNRLLQLTPEERERGVVAFSSGNHAQGVAIAARRLGIPAAIVMPADAPEGEGRRHARRGRRDRLLRPRATESREEIAARMSAETGATVVPSFDDPTMVAGQGTVGLEIVEQMGAAAAAGSSFHAAAAGSRRESRWRCRKPRSSSSSRKAGTTWRARWRAADRAGRGADAPPTRCDALQTKLVSPLTFGGLRERGARGAARSARRRSKPRCASPGAAPARRRAGRRGRARRVARGQGSRPSEGSVVDGVGRECRSGASRPESAQAA